MNWIHIVSFRWAFDPFITVSHHGLKTRDEKQRIPKTSRYPIAAGSYKETRYSLKPQTSAEETSTVPGNEKRPRPDDDISETEF